MHAHKINMFFLEEVHYDAATWVSGSSRYCTKASACQHNTKSTQLGEQRYLDAKDVQNICCCGNLVWHISLVAVIVFFLYHLFTLKS